MTTTTATNFKYLHLVDNPAPPSGTTVCYLDHRLCTEVQAMLTSMVSRMPEGGVVRRYGELVEKVAKSLWEDLENQPLEGPMNMRERAEDRLCEYPLHPVVVEHFAKWVGEYGHSSIVEANAEPMVFIDGISRWLAWLLFDNPLVSGQEASTRALDFGKRPMCPESISEYGHALGVSAAFASGETQFATIQFSLPKVDPQVLADVDEKMFGPLKKLHDDWMAIRDAELSWWKEDFRKPCPVCDGIFGVGVLGPEARPDCATCGNTRKKHPTFDPQAGAFRPAFDRSRWALPGTISTGCAFSYSLRAAARSLATAYSYATESQNQPAIQILDAVYAAYWQAAPGLAPLVLKKPTKRLDEQLPAPIEPWTGGKGVDIASIITQMSAELTDKKPNEHAEPTTFTIASKVEITEADLQNDEPVPLIGRPSEGADQVMKAEDKRILDLLEKGAEIPATYTPSSGVDTVGTFGNNVSVAKQLAEEEVKRIRDEKLHLLGRGAPAPMITGADGGMTLRPYVGTNSWVRGPTMEPLSAKDAAEYEAIVKEFGSPEQHAEAIDATIKAEGFAFTEPCRVCFGWAIGRPKYQVFGHDTDIWYVFHGVAENDHTLFRAEGPFTPGERLVDDARHWFERGKVEWFRCHWCGEVCSWYNRCGSLERERLQELGLTDAEIANAIFRERTTEKQYASYGLDLGTGLSGAKPVDYTPGQRPRYDAKAGALPGGQRGELTTAMLSPDVVPSEGNIAWSPGDPDQVAGRIFNRPVTGQKDGVGTPLAFSDVWPHLIPQDVENDNKDVRVVLVLTESPEQIVRKLRVKSRNSRRGYVDPQWNQLVRVNLVIQCSLAAATDWHRHRTGFPWKLGVVITDVICTNTKPWHINKDDPMAKENTARMIEIDHHYDFHHDADGDGEDLDRLLWLQIRTATAYDEFRARGDYFRAMLCLPLGTRVQMSTSMGLRDFLYMTELRGYVSGANHEYLEQAQAALSELDHKLELTFGKHTGIIRAALGLHLPTSTLSKQAQ